MGSDIGESDRMWNKLDSIDGKLDDLSKDVAAMKAVSHRPDDCPGVARVEKDLHDHKAEVKDREKQNYWRGACQKALELGAAVLAGFTGSKL